MWAIKTRVVESLDDIDFSDIILPMFHLYDHPKDQPDKIVARLWEGAKGVPTSMVLLFDNIDQARAMFEPRYFFLMRHPRDEPKIMGTYM